MRIPARPRAGELLLPVLVALPALLAPAALLAGCEGSGPVADAPLVLTPAATGLYRADLEGRRGLLLFAAHPDRMTVAYDTAAAGVYLAWRGSVRRPDTGLAGRLYWRQGAPRPWTLRRGSDTLVPEVRFAGYATEPGSFEARFLLLVPGDTVRVKQVLVHDDHYGAEALESLFEFSGLGEGLTAALLIGQGGQGGRSRPGPWPVLWAVSGGRVEGPEGAETYVQEFDGPGSFKATFEGSQSGGG